MLTTMFFFVALDAAAKYLLQFYPTIQVVWARFFFHTVTVLVVLGATSKSVKNDIISARPSLQYGRSAMILVTNGLFFYAIATIELATASTIMFLSPVIVTMLAIPMLGESVGIRRWIGVLIGFAGALLIVRPGYSQIDPAMLVLLLACFSNAIYQVLTRQVRDYDNPITSLFYTGIVGAVVVSVFVPSYWQWPTVQHWPVFVLVGVLGAIGHFCLIRALRVAPASVVSPFSYSSLIWSIGFSYFLFGELPDTWVYAGGALIIASGLYILHRERQLQKQLNVPGNIT